MGHIFNRGDAVFVYSTTKNMISLDWKDGTHVLMLSTLPHITNQIGYCMRNTIDTNGRFRKIAIPRPKIVEEYSGKMYYVDKG